MPRRGLVFDPAAMRGEVRFESVSFRYPVAPAQLEVADETATARRRGAR